MSKSEVNNRQRAVRLVLIGLVILLLVLVGFLLVRRNQPPPEPTLAEREQKLEAALLELRGEKYAEALSIFEELLARDAEDEDANRGAYLAATNMRLYEKMADYLSATAADFRAQQTADVYATLSSYYYLCGLKDPGEKWLKAGLELYPEVAVLKDVAAGVYLQLKDASGNPIQPVDIFDPYKELVAAWQDLIDAVESDPIARWKDLPERISRDPNLSVERAVELRRSANLCLIYHYICADDAVGYADFVRTLRTNGEYRGDYPNYFGNTPGNINNDGLFVEQNDLIYYQKFAAHDIMRLSVDFFSPGNPPTPGNPPSELIHRINAVCLNLIGDNLIFIAERQGERIYMADPDGDYDPQVLVDEAAERLLVCGSSLYYRAPDDGGKLKSAPIRDLRLRSALRHRLSPLGEEIPLPEVRYFEAAPEIVVPQDIQRPGVEVTATAIGSYTTDGSHVFYTSIEENRHLYVAERSGAQPREIFANRVDAIVPGEPGENGIYFINLSDEARIWYLSGYADDGGTVSAACLGDMPNCAQINYYYGRLYFVPAASYICYYPVQDRAHPGNAGSVIRANNREPVSTPLLIRDWIFYRNEDIGGGWFLYGLRSDGSNEILIDDVLSPDDRPWER